MPKSRARKPSRSARPAARAGAGSSFWQAVPLIEDPPPAPPARRTAVSAPAPSSTTSPVATLRDLERISRDLADLQRRRSRLLARRSEVVADLRAQGTSWATLSAVTGTTRQGLLRTGGAS